MNELSAGAWRLFLYLARCRNQATGKCCPSVATSQEAIGVSRSAVFMARRHLIEANWARFDGDTVTWLKFFNPDEAMPPAETEGIVYVVGDGFGHYKIGYTANMEQRLQVLNTGLPTDLEVAISYSTPHARNEETRLHRLFKEKRLKGEWFALTDDDLETIRSGIVSPENKTESPDNKTNLRVVKSRKRDSESKKTAIGVQKIGPVVQKAALLYKEEQDERTRLIEQDEGKARPNAVPPSVAYIRQLTRRYPDKTLWPRIVKTLGEDFDEGRLTECYEDWVSHGWNKMNLVWLFEWYVKGIPQSRNGHARPSLADRNKAAFEEAARQLGIYDENVIEGEIL